GAALTRGFQVTFYVLAVIAGLGAIAAAVLMESHPSMSDAPAASVSDAAEVESERLREVAWKTSALACRAGTGPIPKCTRAPSWSGVSSPGPLGRTGSEGQSRPS